MTCFANWTEFFFQIFETSFSNLSLPYLSSVLPPTANLFCFYLHWYSGLTSETDEFLWIVFINFCWPGMKAARSVSPLNCLCCRQTENWWPVPASSSLHIDSRLRNKRKLHTGTRYQCRKWCADSSERCGRREQWEAGRDCSPTSSPGRMSASAALPPDRPARRRAPL